ncbi:MAG: glycosyltransferase [Verrucomicrobiales bacterium]|nr:glycosyltransferase [Verrucomicrobiales bacterium]
MSDLIIAGRVRTSGKFFRLGAEKFYVKGVTYGPFAPNLEGEHFAAPEQTVDDFRLMQELGVNLVRIYYVPPRWLLDLAQQHGLKLLIDVPWNKEVCFLDSKAARAEARQAVRAAAQGCAAHPAVFALSVVNEIPPDIVRWSGAGRVAEFIDELVAIVKQVHSDCLCTFGNFPPTEFLRPQSIDFHCFNVYLHYPKSFENYLARLQMIADAKPLVLGEFGVDTLREGEERQGEILSWKIELTFRGGAAGAVIYSFTDEWFKGGEQVRDWAFGLTRSDRKPKQSFGVTQRLFQAAPYFPPRQLPLVSVVVAAFNGARTLPACLDSLQRLKYPAYEVILVDDGSTDATPEIAARYARLRYLRHEKNQGLSVARNTGIEAAKGEIVAFTDSDCRADEDWLYYLIGDLLSSRFAGIGGHNLLPPEDSWIATTVMVSPGGPAHVMLTDRVAEHIPGCNMAFYKWALQEIGGFDPIFRKAGDDVDACWRLQQRGYQLGFSPAGFVWHYRRSTVLEYLKQQNGYGESEALLVRRHPEYFNWFGGSQWQGRIYSPAKFGIITRKPIIYHGVFSSGFFQTLYTGQPDYALMFLTSLEYHVLVTTPLLVLGSVFQILVPLGITSFLVSLAVCAAGALQAELPKGNRNFWSRPLVALLFFLQPIVRGWARYREGLLRRRASLTTLESAQSRSAQPRGQRFETVEYWNQKSLHRIDFIAAIIEELDKKKWPNKSDAGWNDFDVEVYGSRWCHGQVLTAAEALCHRQQVIRCRLQTRWTLFAKSLFWSMVGLELLIAGSLESLASRWLWLLPIPLPLFVWWMRKQRRDMQRVLGAFLDGVARQIGLVKVEPRSPTLASPTSAPAQQPIALKQTGTVV